MTELFVPCCDGTGCDHCGETVEPWPAETFRDMPLAVLRQLVSDSAAELAQRIYPRAPRSGAAQKLSSGVPRRDLDGRSAGHAERRTVAMDQDV